MFLGVVVLSFLVAWLRGGRLKEDLNLRLMWLAPAALILQTASKYFFPMSIQGAATVLSYAMLIAFALTNMGNLGVRLIFIGMLLNALVIAANLGHMPVHLDMARSLGIGVKQIESGPWGKHQALTDETRLGFLGDVIPVPFPIPSMISIGDISAVIGAFLLVQDMMGKRVRLPWEDASR